MGNDDNIGNALACAGTNKMQRFNDGYFSFAFGDEIALVLNRNYYILNCDEKLWSEVKSKVKEFNLNKKKLIEWWYLIKNKYEISDYSGDFKDLK